MRRISPKAMKALWVVHVCVSGIWMGSELSMLVLALVAGVAQRAALLGLWFAIGTLGAISGACVAITILVALVYGVLTPWGFSKHRWVMTKWVMLLITFAVGVGVILRAIGANIRLLLADSGAQLAVNAAVANNQRLIAGLEVLVVATLVAMVAIAKVRPWDRSKKATAF